MADAYVLGACVRSVGGNAGLNGGREQHPSGVLDVLLDPDKESDRFPAVQQSMIV
jgi:hypothetical protein